MRHNYDAVSHTGLCWREHGGLLSCTYLDIALAQRIVDHIFVFLHQHRACAVHDVAPCCAVGIDQVNGGKQQLLLEVGAAPDVISSLAGLQARTDKGNTVNQLTG